MDEKMPRFKVTEEDVEVLRITVLEGRGISVGWSDMVDTPDPYVKVCVSNSPNGLQRTMAIPDDKNPKWDKELLFFLDPDKERILTIIVMDEDFGFDDTVGTQTYDLKHLKVGETVYHTFEIGKFTRVDVKMVLEINTSKQLRYGHDICEDEKDFIGKRKEKVLEAMKKVFTPEQAPKNVNEVPTIAVIGSGGGFRAMCGFAGVFSALENTGILDCTTFVSGLSGSTWYISTLYSHSIWPKPCCDAVAQEIQDRIDESFTRFLTPFHLAKYFEYMNKKSSLGYPVSFTDFFGCLVGDTLLQDMKYKFSHSKDKITDGLAPMPLCTAIHVEKDVSAQTFSEWLEFTPYEVGIWRYGVFLKTEHFGGKFYKGRLIRQNQEPFLHYLQGVWGSAFTILFQRLLNSDEPSSKDDGKTELAEFCASDALRHKHGESESDDEVETDTEDAITGEPEKKRRKAVKHKTKEKDQPFWQDWLDTIINASPTLSSRQGRAAEIHNFFRGLKVNPVDSKDDARVISNTVKNVFLVDGGLYFNSPFACVVRPERNVQLILSFDFSQRDSDSTPPFSELLLAEEWARENKLPFPPVKDDPALEDPDIKELYIFEDKQDSNCPVVMHFVLINKTFREFKEPGVPRETDEEKAFADFQIFDDPKAPYSSFKFDYTHETFQRLFQLTKFNTLLNIGEIKTKIAHLVTSRRNNHTQ